MSIWSIKSWLPDNNIQIYSTPNKGKSVVAVKFIRTLRIKLKNLWHKY